MSKIIWISSYPKSGNTWMRYFIANYFFNKKRISNPYIIKNIKAFPNTEILQKISNKDELIANPYDISKYWIKSQELIKIENGNVCFLKNHNALVNIKNHPFTNETHSLSGIYIIRDPRDVVVSYAKYKNMSYDRAIKDVCCKELLYVLSKKYVFPRVDILGSWKYHFLSWKDGMKKMPKIFVKYEDLINDSYGNFYKIIDFLSKILNFEINTEQIKFSIKYSSFEKLKKYENTIGFFENETKTNFFRSGKIGNWKNELSISQIKHIETEFKSEMKLHGYL
ncbi:sulfotransferase domain-containing protein [Alphaproteobacteria bacterium]|nr:sulfotransferase domain-containing protein [Alphaproteobacteria bacterium]